MATYSTDSDTEEDLAATEPRGQAGQGLHPALRPEDTPALFWDELPENPEEHPDAAALQSIIEDTTPDERAAGFKDMGNQALKAGLRARKKFYLRQAIEQYSKGLELVAPDPAVNAALCTNRAHVNLLLGNMRNAYTDGLAALRHDPHNVKAFYRAAKGALGMGRFERCAELCSSGLEADPGNTELAALQKRAGEEAVRDAALREEQELRAELNRSPSAALADALLARGWRVGRPQFSIGGRKPFVDNDGLVHWPALFFYPEAGMQSDTVEDMCEEDVLGDHLDVMFGGQAPPLDWDAAGEYSRPNIELYYLSHAAKPLERDQLVEALYGGWPEVREEGPQRYGPQAAGWQRVRESRTLRDTLARLDHVIPGVPAFFVLARGTDFAQRFLEGDLPLL